jgi:hypothetical protein
MAGYIGAKVGTGTANAADIKGDISSTDTSPDLTLKNTTQEDTDGGRESTITFKGEQTGGEESTLAEIRASHDGTSDDQKGDLIFKTNDGSDNNTPTSRSRIDSAGNFIFVHDTNIGTDPSVNNYLGISARATGQLDVSGSSPALDVNNRSGNGDIAIFRSGAQTICAIGVANTDNLYIVNPETDTQKGIRLSDSQLVSCNTSGSSTDNELDLGGVSERFKDLYLGGGLHIGGTGAANKLEDYEEGTFTPLYTAGGGTITTASNAGKYVKVGDLVHCHFRIRSTGVSSLSGAIGISGFPFTAVSDVRSAGSKWFARNWGADMPNFNFGIVAGTTAAALYKQAMNAGASSVNSGDFSTGGDDNVLEASITYQVA